MSKEKKKKKSIGRMILTVLGFVMLFLATVALTVVFLTVRPPDISGEKNPNGSANAEIENRAAGVYSVLVVGTDKEGLNTDTIMVASLDTKNKRASVMSIPRDTMSNVSRNVKKINAAYAAGAKDGVGNIDNLKKEVSYLMGFPMDNYVIIDLTAFEELIDALGGVTIDVPRDMHYDDPYQDLHIHIDKGLQTLNGKDAIGFVRYRKGYAEGDLGRVKAQQLFISALAEQVATPATVTKLPQLTDIVLDNMKTDLTYGELVWFVKEAVTIDMSTNLHMFTLPGIAEMVKPEGSYQKLSYYLPYEDKILEIVNEYFNPYSRDLVSLNVVDTDKLLQQAAVQRVPVEEEVDDPTVETDGDEAVDGEENEKQDGESELDSDGNDSDETNTDESGTDSDADLDVNPEDSDKDANEDLDNDLNSDADTDNTTQEDSSVNDETTSSNIPGEVLKDDGEQKPSDTVEEEVVAPAAPDEQEPVEESTPTVEEQPDGGIPGEVLKSDAA